MILLTPRENSSTSFLNWRNRVLTSGLAKGTEMKCVNGIRFRALEIIRRIRMKADLTSLGFSPVMTAVPMRFHIFSLVQGYKK